MNILYLTNHLNIGGISSYVLTLARGLRAKGHNIYLASSGGELLPKFIQAGIVYIPAPLKTKSEVSPKIVVSLFKLLGALRRNNIDILHSNSRTTGVLGSLLSSLTHTAHISTCHGFFKPRLWRRLFGCWGDRTIAISQAVKEHLMEDFGVKAENISIVHNGIDINRFRVQSAEYRVQKKKDLGLGEGPIVGIVARLSDVKGHIYLIEAMKTVLEKIPDAQLLIVGEGKMEKELKALVQKLKIENNVNFVPSVYETPEILSIMDLFVMPSLKEGLGLSLIEAMAQGLAVIGSDVGGIRSLIKHDYTGILVEPRDSNQLSSEIINLLRDAQKRKFLGAQAQSFVSQNFSGEQMATETEGVYSECLNAKS
ncbi:MAG: glycosyltransferase family 4 protein [Candidatus Omnitrophica bacterium]|nr:glycosyltransferase family 4 protein [Candidatus Omnitrophota bacterium]